MEPFEKCEDNTISLLSDVIRQKAEDGVATIIIAEDSKNLTKLCDLIYRP